MLRSSTDVSGCLRTDLELAADVQLERAVGPVDDLGALDAADGLDDAALVRLVARVDREVAQDVVAVGLDEHDVADRAAGLADRGRDAAEHARAVVDPHAQREGVLGGGGLRHPCVLEPSAAAPGRGRACRSAWTSFRGPSALSRAAARSTSATRSAGSGPGGPASSQPSGTGDRAAADPVDAALGPQRSQAAIAIRFVAAWTIVLRTSIGRSPSGRGSTGQLVGTQSSSAPSSATARDPLRELEVVADHQPDPAVRRVDHRRARVARAEALRLAVPEVGLAVDGADPGRVDQRRAVVERAPSSPSSGNPPAITMPCAAARPPRRAASARRRARRAPAPRRAPRRRSPT